MFSPQEQSQNATKHSIVQWCDYAILLVRSFIRNVFTGFLYSIAGEPKIVQSYWLSTTEWDTKREQIRHTGHSSAGIGNGGHLYKPYEYKLDKLTISNLKIYDKTSPKN